MIFIFFFNNSLSVNDLLDNGFFLFCKTIYTFTLTVWYAKWYSPLQRQLKISGRFFKKEIRDNYQFYHGFVMKVTTLSRKIDFLRRRVKLENRIDRNDMLTIFISKWEILALKLFSLIFKVIVYYMSFIIPFEEFESCCNFQDRSKTSLWKNV